MCSLVGNLVCTEFVKGLQGFDTVWCMMEYVLVYICLVYILFDVGLHIVWTKFCLAQKNSFVPAWGVVVQAINQGAVAVHQHRATLIVHFVCLRLETAQTTRPNQHVSRVGSVLARVPS